MLICDYIQDLFCQHNGSRWTRNLEEGTGVQGRSKEKFPNDYNNGFRALFGMAGFSNIELFHLTIKTVLIGADKYCSYHISKENFYCFLGKHIKGLNYVTTKNCLAALLVLRINLCRHSWKLRDKIAPLNSSDQLTSQNKSILIGYILMPESISNTQLWFP